MLNKTAIQTKYAEEIKAFKAAHEADPKYDSYLALLTSLVIYIIEKETGATIGTPTAPAPVVPPTPAPAASPTPAPSAVVPSGASTVATGIVAPASGFAQVVAPPAPPASAPAVTPAVHPFTT